MRVITLIGDDFKEACRLLKEKIDKQYKPDIVIGILTGGGYVGREISKAWPSAKYIETSIRRKSTKKKENGLRHKVLQTLPYFLLNWLRMAEMIYGNIKAKRFNPKREGEFILSSDIDELLKEKEQYVLLVDDAIDTGATLNLAYESLSSKYPLAVIKIAVVTVTNNKPMIDADYYLYHDRILVRFPWSNDIKQSKK